MATTTFSNLVKTVIHQRHLANTFCAYSTIQRTCCLPGKSLLRNVSRSMDVTNHQGADLLVTAATSSVMLAFYRMKSLHVADTKTSLNLGFAGIEVLEDFTALDDAQIQQEVCQEINNSLEQGEAGRLYAVVYIRTIQHKVTPGDIIIVKLDFPPNVGDRIRLEKVLAVGGKDFSLIGQPLLSRDTVRVEATVVEKTLSHNRVWFVYRKRKNFQKFHLFREMYTMLVINSVQVATVPAAASRKYKSSEDLPEI